MLSSILWQQNLIDLTFFYQLPFTSYLLPFIPPFLPPLPMKKNLLFRSFAALLLLAGATSIHAESVTPKHAITHEDVWLMKRIGAPLVSPDGKWAVFSVTDPAYDSKSQWSDLWLKSLVDDTPARRLTFSKSAESGLNWSPDSRQLAFVAKRDGDEAAQIYLLDLAAGGGEAQRLTHLTLGARQPKWSPDGKQILFVSDIYPGNADEEAVKKSAKEHADKKTSARSYESFPPRFFDKWLDEKKVRLFVTEAKPGAVARDVLSHTKLARLSGFGGAQSDDGQLLDAVWTPDGKAIVFSASSNRDQAARAAVYSQIYLLALGGGEAQAISHDTHSYSHLKFSSDGKTLFFLSDLNTPGKIYDLHRLASLPWPADNQAPTILTPALDRSIDHFALPEGSQRVFFTYEHAGLEQLHSIAYAGGAVRDESSPASGTITSLSAGGKALVGAWEAASSPAEIYAFDHGPKRLTSFNTDKAASIDWLPAEHFWFKTADGRQIHNMLIKPPGFNPKKKYPLLSVIHGGAASMWRDQFVLRWNYHLLAQPGYVVLLTDYKGSTGYGEEFARSIQFDPLRGPGDELNQAVDEAIKKYPFIDGSRLAAAGASYGGHLANWLQATTTRYKAIVSHAGEMDLVMQWGTSDSVFGREVNSGGPVWGNLPVWREQSPVMQAGNHDKGTGFKTPILITVGELDYRVPINNALMNFATQQRLGVPSKLIVFPDENHWILKGENSRFFYSQLHAWLAKWL